MVRWEIISVEEQFMRKERRSHMFELPTNLRPFSDEAIVRIQYLLPENEVILNGSTMTYTASSEDEATTVLTEIRYALYRAKVRAEGERERAIMFRAVFGS